MANEYEIRFRTLLTKGEYLRLTKQFPDAPSNLQINYYFDTPRFTLKASEMVLRVRKRTAYELTLKRKKGYNKYEVNVELTEAEFQEFLTSKVIPSEEIKNEIGDLIKGQEIVNYMSLSTFRIFFPFKKGTIALDKCEYIGETDYELEYEAVTYEQGRREFVELVKEFGIAYKRGETKIKRAYNALKRKI